MTDTIRLPETIEHVGVDAVLAYAKNSRTHSADQVAAVARSIRAYGFTNPILIHGATIIAGHGRVMAAKQIGLATVPAIRLDHLTEAEARAYVIADNRLAELAGWDEAILAEELRALQGEGFDLDLTGFSDAEITELLFEETTGNTDADDAPPVHAVVITNPGDVWVMGNHRLMCGDSTDAGSVAMLMNGDRCDMCFTSPPYGAGNVAKLRDHYVRGAEKRESFYDQHEDRPSEWADLMRGWYAAAKKSCDVVVCNVQMLADNKVAMVNWLYDVRADLCDVVIWDKGHGAPQMQSNILNNVFEFVFIIGGNGSRSVPFSSFHGSVPNVVRVNPKGKNDHAEVHRAVMPVDLALWAMRDLCSKAQSVYEPFSGSGTTIIASEQTGRRCYAMELSPQYVDVAVRRWQNFTGQRAIHAVTGEPFGD